MQALTRNRDYLAEHRRMIIGRALAAAMAGSLPLPLIEEWLSATILRGTVRRIARSRGVDMDPPAVAAVADGAEGAPEWAEIVSGRILYRFLSRSWRRALVAALAVRRLQAAQESYLIGTLFDHYCARLHVGLGLEADSGRELRRVMDEAILRTEGGLSRTMFRRAVLASARRTLRIPLGLLGWAGGGKVKKLLKRRHEAEAVSEVDLALEEQLRAKSGFLSRAATAIEFSLAAEANPYLHRLLENFERTFRERQKSSDPQDR